MLRRAVLVVVLSVVALSGVSVPEALGEGEVHVPLSVYEQLLKSANASKRPPASSYALGHSSVRVQATDDGSRLQATVHVTVELRRAYLELPVG